MKKQQEQKIMMMDEITKLDDSTRVCIGEIKESVLLIDVICKTIEGLMPNVYSELGELGITQSREWLSNLTEIKESNLWRISQLKTVIDRCEILEVMLTSIMDLPDSTALDAISDSISGVRLVTDTIAGYQVDITNKLKEAYIETEATRRLLC